MNTKHYSEDRMDRENLIMNIIGMGTVIKVVTLDRGHRNGPERHEISDTGIVTVYNVRTNRLVTKLIARPAQLARYWEDGRVPTEVYNLARYHTKMGYNMR